MNNIREQLNDLDPKDLLNLLIAYRFILLSLITLGLLGFALLQVQGVSNPAVNQTKFDEGKDQLQAKAIRFNEDTLERIRSLKVINVDVEPGQLGKNNPFE